MAAALATTARTGRLAEDWLLPSLGGGVEEFESV
jgi:hypothetical protein